MIKTIRTLGRIRALFLIYAGQTIVTVEPQQEPVHDVWRDFAKELLEDGLVRIATKKNSPDYFAVSELGLVYVMMLFNTPIPELKYIHPVTKEVLPEQEEISYREEQYTQWKTYY